MAENEASETDVEVGEGDEVPAEPAEPVEPPLSKNNIVKALSQIGRGAKDRNTYCLTRLDMQRKGLTSLDGELALFPDLRHADFSNNNLTSMKGLKVLQNLMSLNMQTNQITQFDASGYENSELVLLQLDSNTIESFENFNMPNLQCLSISGNKIQDLCKLEMPTEPTLQLLNLSHNALVGLMGLDRFQNLTQLSIANNQLTSLEGIQSCFALQVLDVSHNQLPNVDEFEKLQTCKALKKLTATGNTAIYDLYPDDKRPLLLAVVLMLPALESFDAFSIDAGVRIDVDDIRKKKGAAIRAQEEAELAEAASAAAAANASEAAANNSGGFQPPEDIAPLNLTGIAPDGGVAGENMPFDALTGMSTNITEDDAA